MIRFYTIYDKKDIGDNDAGEFKCEVENSAFGTIPNVKEFVSLELEPPCIVTMREFYIQNGNVDIEIQCIPAYLLVD